MHEERRSVVTAGHVNALVSLLRAIRLAWRLMFDRRVPVFPKAIMVAALVYVISPVGLGLDLIPIVGELDDIAALLLGIALFIALCPRDIVEEHRRVIEQSQTSTDQVVKRLLPRDR